MRRLSRIGGLVLLGVVLGSCDEDEPPRSPGTSAGTPSGTPVGAPSGSTTGGAPSGSTAAGTTTDSDTGATTTPTTVCVNAFVTPGYLDPLQVPGNGMVTFCHRLPGGAWALLTMGTGNCLAHVAHGQDLFPTTLCDS